MSKKSYTSLNVLRNHSIAPAAIQTVEGSKANSTPGTVSEPRNPVAFAQGAA